MNRVTIQIFGQTTWFSEYRKYTISMNVYYISLLFLQKALAREQYPWYGSQDLDTDVDLLLKQGLKIGYLSTKLSGMITITLY